MFNFYPKRVKAGVTSNPGLEDPSTLEGFYLHLFRFLWIRILNLLRGHSGGDACSTNLNLIWSFWGPLKPLGSKNEICSQISSDNQHFFYFSKVFYDMNLTTNVLKHLIELSIEVFSEPVVFQEIHETLVWKITKKSITALLRQQGTDGDTKMF